jgi:WD40 repeat protein
MAGHGFVCSRQVSTRSTHATGPERLADLAYAPGGDRLAVSTRSGIVIWDLATGRPEHQLAEPLGGVGCLAWSADGRLLAFGAGDGLVRLWDVAAATGIQILADHGKEISSLVWSPDARQIASGSYDRTIKNAAGTRRRG